MDTGKKRQGLGRLNSATDVELARLHPGLRGRLTVGLPTPLLFKVHCVVLRCFSWRSSRPADLEAASQRRLLTEPWCCAAFSALSAWHTTVQYRSTAPRDWSVHSGTPGSYTIACSRPRSSTCSLPNVAEEARSLPTVQTTRARLCARSAIGLPDSWSRR